MTLKNKLARLQGLQSEEERIKAEIASIRNNIQSVNVRKYDYDELREKYNNLDFTSITKTDLTDLMLSDFQQSNLKEIEKRELYEHNMMILNSILENVKPINHYTYSNIDEAKSNINISTTKTAGRRETKQITIRAHHTEASDDEYVYESDLEPETIDKLNEIIDKEYAFNLKILRTLCIYYHYRDIKLPTQAELTEIKEDLEGWVFVPKEEFITLKNKCDLIYLTIENEKIVAITDAYFIKCLNPVSIEVYNYNTKKRKKLNKYNPVFRRILIEDASPTRF